MNKLKAIIQYECSTSFKYIWRFYGILYSIMLFIFAIVSISTGSLKNVGSNCFEFHSMIFVSILGVLGFKEDFKMLLQNGFPRKYIFWGELSMFLSTSVTMALVDTVVGHVLHHFIDNYASLFGSIYGYDNIPANFI